MPQTPQKTADPPQDKVEENVYADVYRVLLGGMIVSSALFALGMVRALLLHTYFPLTPQWVQQHYRWSVVMHGLATLDPTSLMLVGAVLLILTPVARVLVSIYAFYVDHDRKYVAVTGTVFLIIVLTVLLSHFAGLA
jgi:uncharacterized membrane protein